MIPIITEAGLYFGALVGNSVLTEIVVNRPGLGELILGALNSRDYALFQWRMMVFASQPLVIHRLAWRNLEGRIFLSNGQAVPGGHWTKVNAG